MKTNKTIGLLCAAMMTISINSASAESKADPVVGGAIIAVNVDVEFQGVPAANETGQLLD